MKNKNNNYGKKNFQNGNHGGDFDYKKDSSQKKVKNVTQDWTWYAKVAEDAKNFASFPFAEALGEPILLTREGVLKDFRFSGIMQHRFYPSIGWQGGDLDTAETAANAYFTAMTQGFTGNVDFEAPDALMTAICGAGIAYMIAMGKRAYGLMKKMSLYNLYERAEPLVSACGFQYQDLKGNLANFRADLNNYIAQINEILVLPKQFSLTDRWVELCSNVFVDDDQISKHKLIVALPVAYPIWTDGEEIEPNEGTAVEMRRLPNYMTCEEYFEVLNDMKNALSRQDVRQIFGAIKRVYNDSSDLIQFTPIDENFDLPLAFSKVWLSQFHSMTNHNPAVVHYGVVSEDGDSIDLNAPYIVYQRGGRVRSTPVIGESPSNSGVASMTRFVRLIVDAIDPNVKPEEMLDYTAAMSGYDRTTRFTGNIVGDINTYYYALHCRSEIWVSSNVFKASDSGTGAAQYDTFNYRSAVSFNAFLITYGFNFAPIRYAIDDTTGGLPVIMQEVCNYTSLSMEDLSKLNDRCMFKLLSLPMNTKSVTR